MNNNINSNWLVDKVMGRDETFKIIGTRPTEYATQNKKTKISLPEEIPAELQIEIFLFLRPEDTAHSLVCKQWRALYNKCNIHKYIFELGCSRTQTIDKFAINRFDHPNHTEYHLDVNLLSHLWEREPRHFD